MNDKKKDGNTNQSMNIKQDILKFLSDTANLYESYHNHKELSAWGALVFYVLLIMGVLNAIKNEPTEPYKIGAIAFISIVGFIINCFICIQFEGRRKAANYVSACQDLTGKCLFEEIDLFEEEKEKKELYEKESKKQKSKVCKPEFMADYYLPKIIIVKAEEIRGNKKAQKARIKLEWLVQCLLILALIAAGLIIWFKTP